MRIIQSIIARCQKKTLDNYAKTSFSKNIKKFHNIHKGKRCFILGNGPSLSPADLDRLHELGEITFAMNRVFKIFPQTKWRPTYYFCEDELIAQGCLDDMNNVEAKEKFIPLVIKYYHGIKINKANYFNLVYDDYKRENLISDFDASVGVPCMGTVTTTAIFFAVYMGFKEIYLLGVDHNFKITIADDGSTVTDNSVKDYFCDNYDKDVIDKVTHDLRNTTKSYMKMRDFCEKNNVSIKNATRGGKLEVFPRASIDDLIFQD
jgi:hypothetical protein